MDKPTPFDKQNTNGRRLVWVLQGHWLADPESIHVLTVFAPELFRMTSSWVVEHELPERELKQVLNVIPDLIRDLLMDKPTPFDKQNTNGRRLVWGRAGALVGRS